MRRPKSTNWEDQLERIGKESEDRERENICTMADSEDPGMFDIEDGARITFTTATAGRVLEKKLNRKLDQPWVEAGSI